VAIAALALVVLALAAIRRIATEGAPPLLIQRTVAAHIRFPGSPPVLAWPREGQAAMEVEGVGGLGSSGASAPVPIASVAKVMTAYLVLREHPLAAGAEGFTITITPADVRESGQRAAAGQSTVAVRAGERISERRALEALLLPSANNIAALLAAHAAGGPAAFVARMNVAARRLGMLSTTYTDPSGLDDETVSTASDQLKLAGAAMRSPVFASIVRQPSVQLPVAGRVANYDNLVGSDGYVGVKTGSDRAAGGCFVFAKRVTLGPRRVTVLGVVLGQREGSLIEGALSSARRLGDSAAAAMAVRTVLPAGTTVLRASSTDGRRTTAATAGAIEAVGWGGLMLPVRVLSRAATLRPKAGEQMARVIVGGVGGATSAAVATRSVAGPSFGWRLEHLL
jgi:serine-type D-Ala-D-Ala carboxypeptidase (penicillin-binding protein 5/6)